MKISAINVHNFLGVRAVEAKLTKPVTIFAGPNHSGKSSLQEAIRIALTGESVRVLLKRDYALLVNDTEKTGFAEIEVDGAHAFITLPDGKTAPASDYQMPATLPYVLDAQRFASLTPDARRTFLYGLMGLSADGPEVKARLLAKNCDAARVDLIMPLMRSGFDAAHKEALDRAREAKAAWRAITGETYGEKKAETWHPDYVRPEATDAPLSELEVRLNHAITDLDAANQRLGVLLFEHKRHTEAAGKVNAFKDMADRLPRIAEKLARDQVELDGWVEKVDALKAYLLAQREGLPCPACGAMLALKDGVLVHSGELATVSDDDLAKLPDYEKALGLMQKAVANGKRDLAEASAAKKTLEEIASISGTAPTEAELNAARTHLDELKTDRDGITAAITQMRAIELLEKEAQVKAEKAKAAHQSVQAWSRIADAMAPDGIPGEILAAALDPLNDRLESSHTDTDWLRVHVRSDMSIETSYPRQKLRSYSLLSESEKWRADAMLAEAISHLSGLRILCLDRLDVLDIQGRADLVVWLDVLVEDEEIQSAILFGTLKAVPNGLPDSFEAIWIDKGVVEMAKEAA